MKPVVDRLKEQYGDRIEFTIYVDDTDAAGEAIAEQLAVRYVPTFVFVATDGSVASMDVGALSEQVFESRLQALLAK